MLRRVPSKLLLLAGLAPGYMATHADAQVLARAVDRLNPPAEASCPNGVCQPHALTYGFYHESWRRWPEGPTEDSLTPNPPPKSKIDAVEKGPVGEVPEPRDEASSTRRKRPGTTGAPMTTTPLPAEGGPTRGSAPTPSTDTPTEPEGDSLPDSLPDAEPSGPTQNSSPSDTPADGGFFPNVEPGSDTPPSTPEADLPNESMPEASPAPSDSKTPDDDSIDLEDFSQVNPDRARRYHTERRSVYRQAASRPQSSAGGRVQTRKPARKMADRREELTDEVADESSANPLRAHAVSDDSEPSVATTRPRRASRPTGNVASKKARASHVAQVAAEDDEATDEEEIVPAEFLEDQESEESEEIALASADDEAGESWEESDEEEEEIVEVRPAKSSKKHATRSVPVSKKQTVRRAPTKVTAASLKTDASQGSKNRRPATRVNPLRQRSAG